MVSRNFAWIDESIEHSEQDTARATALAAKWSHLTTIAEEKAFRMQADAEDGRFDCDFDTEDEEQEFLQAASIRQAEADLELELIEDKLARIGARMMRPYEHWNEDERLIEYMENQEY